MLRPHSPYLPRTVLLVSLIGLGLMVASLIGIGVMLAPPGTEPALPGYSGSDLEPSLDDVLLAGQLEAFRLPKDPRAFADDDLLGRPEADVHIEYFQHWNKGPQEQLCVGHGHRGRVVLAGISICHDRGHPG